MNKFGSESKMIHGTVLFKRKWYVYVRIHTEVILMKLVKIKIIAAVFII